MIYTHGWSINRADKFHKFWHIQQYEYISNTTIIKDPTVCRYTTF